MPAWYDTPPLMGGGGILYQVEMLDMDTKWRCWICSGGNVDFVLNWRDMVQKKGRWNLPSIDWSDRLLKKGMLRHTVYKLTGYVAKEGKVEPTESKLNGCVAKKRESWNLKKKEGGGGGVKGKC